MMRISDNNSGDVTKEGLSQASSEVDEEEVSGEDPETLEDKKNESD